MYEEQRKTSYRRQVTWHEIVEWVFTDFVWYCSVAALLVAEYDADKREDIKNRTQIMFALAQKLKDLGPNIISIICTNFY